MGMGHALAHHNENHLHSEGGGVLVKTASSQPALGELSWNQLGGGGAHSMVRGPSAIVGTPGVTKNGNTSWCAVRRRWRANPYKRWGNDFEMEWHAWQAIATYTGRCAEGAELWGMIACVFAGAFRVWAV